MAEKIIADNKIHEGHRERMRSKFLAHGSNIFDTYELLEMLLYNVIPYKDTNPISKRLLAAFGGLDGVFTADKESLMTVDGVGARVAEHIINSGKITEILASEPLVERSPFSSYKKVGAFFTDYFKETKSYKISLLLLDNKMMPISISDISGHDCDSGNVTPYLFITEAIKSNASVAIIAHTHPFSTTLPSDGDIAITHLLRDSFNSLGIVLADHYIISGNNYFGFLDRDVGGFKTDCELGRFFESKVNSLNANSEFIENKSFSISGTTSGSYEVKCVAKLLEPFLGEKSLDISHKLYLKYFSFERAISSSYESLTEILGKKAAFYVKLLARITARRTTDKMKPGNIYTEAELANYFKANFIGEHLEKLYLMSFDSRHCFISCNFIAEGTVNLTNVAPRKILEVAFESSAHYVIICHNHPRGNYTPSVNDKTLTNKLALLLTQAKLVLNDHFVISGFDRYSIMKDELC